MLWRALLCRTGVVLEAAGLLRAELQADNPHISMVAVPEGTRLIRRFERDGRGAVLDDG